MLATFVPVDGVEVASSLAQVELGHLDGVVGRRSAEWFVTIPAEVQPSTLTLGKIHIQGGTGGDSHRTVTLPRH